jgi:transketolase
MVSCRKAITGTLERLAEGDRDIVLVATDSRGSVTAGPFAQRFPDQFVEVGIAEQNAVSVACGMAAAGKTVFVTGPACFLAARAYEQVKVDVAYNRADVKIIGVSAGVSYGPLGGTHTALHDYACMRALPNLEVFAPSDAVQAEFLTEYLAASRKPAYLRVGRGDVEAVYAPGEVFSPHHAKQVRAGTDITFIACGETVCLAKRAAELLEASVRVLDFFCLKPADTSAIAQAARETKAILTLEEHSLHGGLGELVCGVVAAARPVPVKMLGFPDEDWPVGSSRELFAHYGLVPETIAAEALALLERT